MENKVVSSRPQNPVISQQTVDSSNNTTTAKKETNLLGITLIGILIVAVIGFAIYKKVSKK